MGQTTKTLKRPHPGQLLACVQRLSSDAARNLSTDKRAEFGQFMTPPTVACFMASMFTKPKPPDCRLLDPGAGVGTLSAAFVSEVCNSPRRPRQLSVTAYEIDPLLAGYLAETLEACRRECEQANIDFTAEVIQEDFIKTGATMASAPPLLRSHKEFDCVIMNPPYQKIQSASEHRRLLSRAGIETTNLYTAFAALAAELLGDGGQIVAITPRSFCNGPYFKHFRTSFLKTMSLRRIHIFESRSAAFRHDDVLQENIIFHAVKSKRKPHHVAISSSTGPDVPSSTDWKVDYDQVVLPNDPDAFIHILTDQLAHEVTARMRKFSGTLDALGITVSTGRVVDFRAREFLRFDPEDATAPLIYPRNFCKGFVEWPLPNGKKPKAMVDTGETQRLLVPAGFYVLTKRFTAKEEPRRVVAVVYDPNRIRADKIGLENHLNYYHSRGRGLPKHLAVGLAAFVNSTLVDAYFRLFNGHTQVNATDLRKLKYPDRSQLQALGRLIGNAYLDQAALDQLVEKELL